MRGTWETTEGGGSLLLPAGIVAGAVVLGGSGAVAALAGAVTSLVEVAGAIVLALLALVALVVVLAYRRGWRPSLNPVVAWHPHAALPPPEAAPLTGRPVQALPGPQQLHIHFHGLDVDQAAEVVRQQSSIEGR